MRGADVTAVGRFRAGSYFTTAGAAATPVGSTTMTRIAVLSVFRPTTGVEEHFWVHSLSLVVRGGWRIRRDSGGAFAWGISDGSPTIREISQTPTSILGLKVLIGTYNETELALHLDGTETTAGPFAGYTAPTLDGVLVGVAPNFTVPTIGIALVGLLASDSVALSAAQRASVESIIQDNLIHGRALDADLSAVFTPEQYWDARDWVPGQSWTDRISSIALAQVGNPEKYGLQGVT